MSDDEQRRYPRRVASDNSEVRFFLRTVDGVYTISRVHDVSPGGVGIDARYRLRIGEQVVLKYRSKDTQVSVCGTVAWCGSAGEQRYAIGVVFAPGDDERNASFYRALRRHLDDQPDSATGS